MRTLCSGGAQRRVQSEAMSQQPYAQPPITSTKSPSAKARSLIGHLEQLALDPESEGRTVPVCRP